MNEVAEVQKKWVDALRSGKFEQGQGFLHKSDGKMCCLGVACEVMGLERLNPLDSTALGYSYGDIHHSTMPRDSDIVRMGLDPLGVSFVGAARSVNLDERLTAIIEVYAVQRPHSSQFFAFMNDDLNCTFENIADYIEVTFGGEW
jgi:hypothetical protein